jgi:membrane protease YdiL (CAAX protease family)
LLVVRVIVGKEWPRRLALRLPNLRHVLLALMCLPGLIFVSSAIHAVAKLGFDRLFEKLGLPPHSGGMEEMVKIFGKWPWYWGVLVIGLGPGIGEELWCRGFLGRGLVGRYGYLVGILLTASFFGIMHVDPPHVIATAFMGIALHFTYITTKSLLIPMMLHTANNSLAVLAMKWQRLAEIDNANNNDNWGAVIVVAAGLLMAAVGWALYQSRARLAPGQTLNPYPWEPDFPGVEHPPPASGTIVVYPRLDLRAVMAVAFAFALLALVLWQALTEAGLGQ